MKERIATWQSAIAEFTDFAHPGLRRIKFVFCDDQPNANKEGIEYEDFPELAKSAIGTPIKIKFLGQGVGGHHSSIPIGYISGMAEREENGVHQLVADGILFADDYPDEVEWLEHEYIHGKAPGVSWEVSYSSELSTIKNGIRWLKGLLTRAATFVSNPAYGNRTAILALASNRNLSANDFYQELIALASNELKSNKEKEGGNNRMDEKELQKLMDDLAQTKTALAEATKALETANSENTKLSDRISVLENSVKEKDDAIAEFTKEKLFNTRLATLSQAGIPIETEPEKLEKKKTFYLSLSDEAFAEYVEELKSVKASASRTERSSASVRTSLPIPRFSGSVDEPLTPLSELGTKFRNLSRNPATTE